MIRRHSPSRIAVLSMLAGAVLTVMPAVGFHSEPRSAPRPMARIDAVGHLSTTAGYAFVDAVVRCPRGMRLALYASIDQDHVVVRGGDGSDERVRCTGRRQRVGFTFASRFRPGQALVRLYGDWCYYQCDDLRVKRFVSLRYARVPLDLPV